MRRRDQAMQGRARLSRWQRWWLPRRLRAELQALEMVIAGQPGTVVEARRLEAVVASYEVALDAGHAILAGRSAGTGQRWRVGVGVAMLFTLAATPGVLMVGAVYADIVESCADSNTGKTANWVHVFSWTAPACVAQDDSQCRHDCERWGECHAVDGACRTLLDSECRSSRACLELGACSLVNGTCQPDDDADCRGSQLCGQAGRCFVERGWDGEPGCAARTDADCAGSEACRSEGACRAQDGRCCNQDQWCRLRQACSEGGACTYDEERGSCIATLDDDCASSSGCIEDGRCTAVAGECRVVSHADCTRSFGCREFRLCLAIDGTCVAPRG